MTKVERLQREAREAAKFRGHTLSPFMVVPYSYGGRACYVARCKVCAKEVIVLPNPQPNEIDISGEAVALNCWSNLEI